MNVSSPVSAVVVLRNWFAAARPSPAVALSQVDDARARGKITRDEYLALLDAWPYDEPQSGPALEEPTQ